MVKKKDYWKYIVIFLIIGVLLYTQTNIFQSVVGEDGFIKTADSSKVITGGWNCNGIYGNSLTGKFVCTAKHYTIVNEYTQAACSFNCPTAQDISVAWTGYLAGISGSDTQINTKSSNTIVVNQDLKYKYYRVSASGGGGDPRFPETCGGISAQLIDNIENPSKVVSLAGSPSCSKGGFGVELIPSVLEPNIVVVMINGAKSQEIDISSWNEVHIRFTTSSGGDTITNTISDSRYQYLFSCQKESNELLGVITYSGGQVVSLSPDGSLTSISEPVTKFCPTHAAILTDQSEGGSTETNEYYYELAKGNAVTVQDDQTLTLFFLFDASGMAVSCSDAEAYDFSSKTCKETSGIATFLREGTVDEANGVVIVNPEIVCQINEVPEGVYYLDQDACIIYKEADVDCTDAGYVYQASTNECVNTAGKSIPASESVEVIKEVTESDCQAQYGETATVLTGSDGKAYACYVKEIQSVYYCNGVVMNEGDVCEVNNAGDVTGISLTTQDESVGLQEFNYTLLYVILALVIGIMVLFILVQKKGKRG